LFQLSKIVIKSEVKIDGRLATSA